MDHCKNKVEVTFSGRDVWYPTSGKARTNTSTEHGTSDCDRYCPN